MGRSSLPPGFRFHPTDVELVMYYLKRKILGKKLCVEAISEVKIYDFSPWDLPDKSCLRSKDREWFFFCPMERKYPNRGRAKRSTDTGYWKATGKDRDVCYNEKVVGKIRTLVFYTGHAPKGNRTDWVMHEYRMEDKDMIDAGVQDAYVLCKVFEKSGLGPKNGEQHGAVFNEEDWDEEDEETTVDELPPPAPLPSSMIVHGQESSVMSLSEPGHLGQLSGAEPSITNEGDCDDLALLLDHDDLALLLDMFREVDTSPPAFNHNNEDLGHNSGGNKNMEGDNIFDDLGNLSEGGGGYNTSLFASIDEALFLELDDFSTPLEHHHPIGEEAATGSQLLSSTDASNLLYNCFDDVNLDQNLSSYDPALDPQSSNHHPRNNFYV